MGALLGLYIPLCAMYSHVGDVTSRSSYAGYLNGGLALVCTGHSQDWMSRFRKALLTGVSCTFFPYTKGYRQKVASTSVLDAVVVTFIFFTPLLSYLCFHVLMRLV